MVGAVEDVLARIDPETLETGEEQRTGFDPVSVAVGGGSVWVSNFTESTVLSVNPHNERVRHTIGVPAGPRGLAIDGRPWVAGSAPGR